MLNPHIRVEMSCFRLMWTGGSSGRKDVVLGSMLPDCLIHFLHTIYLNTVDPTISSMSKNVTLHYYASYNLTKKLFSLGFE